MYDIIGDIHGHATLLKKMLKSLGYQKTNGSFFHPERKLIFVGDFIDRGPEIRQTIQIVRSIVESGNGMAIMGNHEFNAIQLFLKQEEEVIFRRKSPKLKMAMVRTLEQFASAPAELKSHIKWFRTLPFFLEFSGFRVVHACWNEENIDLLKKTFHEPRMKRSELKSALKNASVAKAIEQTLKGYELRLPADLILRDSNGINHRVFRIKWWESPLGKTFNEMSFGNKFVLPSYTAPKEILFDVKKYPVNSLPVFFGHYCLQQPPIVRPNLCCLDSCVVNTGTLTAYRWDGESLLNAKKVVVSGDKIVREDQKDYVYLG